MTPRYGCTLVNLLIVLALGGGFLWGVAHIVETVTGRQRTACANTGIHSAHGMVHDDRDSGRAAAAYTTGYYQSSALTTPARIAVTSPSRDSPSGRPASRWSRSIRVQRHPSAPGACRVRTSWTDPDLHVDGWPPMPGERYALGQETAGGAFCLCLRPSP